MRRSTAAAVGTLTGAALIIGVRLSVTPTAAPVAEAPPPVDVADNSSPSPAGSAASKDKDKAKAPAKKQEAAKSGLKDGDIQGKKIQYPYGAIQVTLKIDGGTITDVAATYPLAGDSATINPRAIPALKQEVLKAQSDKIAAVSGATYTSAAYLKSLQSALDAAKA
ncbi:FMN-binding protein [Actinoplanes sp. NPDC051411]|uniref:FMN-binding protein n=1 Tax=Actinoplanes sp. NPDC051411 TaxID=3155522 RepID=UPI003421D7D0